MAISPSASDERDNPPLADNSLTEAELASSNSWFIHLRWMAAAGVLLAALFITTQMRVGFRPATIWGIGIWILLYNLGFFLVLRRYKSATRSPKDFRRLAYAQMSLDWLATTLLVHATGGIESPVTFFFIFHVVIASMLFSRQISFIFTGVAIALFTIVVLGEYFSLLAHYPLSALQNRAVHTDPLYLLAVLAFFSSTLLIVTYLVTSISESLRRHEAEVITLSESLRLSSARLQALNESAQVVNSTLELPQVLTRLVTNTARVMGVRACSIRLLDKTGKLLEPMAAYGLSQTYLGKGPIELQNSPLDRAVLQGPQLAPTVINIPDVHQSSLLQYPDWAVQEGISSLVSAPLIGKNRPLGILRAYSEDIDHFTADDEAFISAIAAQGSIAIENALTYQTIETLDATKAAFIRVFTHELRSPVSVIRSLLQTILSGYTSDVNPQQRDILERAIRRVDYLRKLIDDLLDLANGRVPQRAGELTAPIMLNGVVENVVHRYELPAREKSLTLEWRQAPDSASCPVRATVEGLDRILTNLVSNAIKYTLPGGKVTVSLSRSADEVCVTVEDTGIGIPDSLLPNLFEEFFRAPNAKELEREGTGLGLSIVRDTVNSFGGRVSVQSRLGVGSAFTVTLPLADIPAS
ncbi:MAG: GAF domain-containing sensor histidine kinase [Anaerolineales bacterium]|nr:GAF domain-containing sensor histidine kinase [Anaerolineales bacterium]